MGGDAPPKATIFAALLASVLVLLIGAPTAGAAHYVSNPDMEASCGPLPCNWTGSTGTQSATGIFHAGATSLGILAPNTSTGGGGFHCVNGAGAGSYDASTWYRATIAGSMQFSLFYFGSPGCSSGLLDDSIGFLSITADSTWRYYGLTGVAPAGTQSILVQINYACSSCPSGATLHVDDVSLKGGSAGNPTAVALLSLRAARGQRGVTIAWRTEFETGLLGFEVWRDGRRLNVTLIKARAGAGGATYHLLDRSAPERQSHVYRLFGVDASGARRLLGVTRVPPRRGIARS